MPANNERACPATNSQPITLIFSKGIPSPPPAFLCPRCLSAPYVAHGAPSGPSASLSLSPASSALWNALNCACLHVRRARQPRDSNRADRSRFRCCARWHLERGQARFSGLVGRSVKQTAKLGVCGLRACSKFLHLPILHHPISSVCRRLRHSRARSRSFCRWGACFRSRTSRRRSTCRSRCCRRCRRCRR